MSALTDIKDRINELQITLDAYGEQANSDTTDIFDDMQNLLSDLYEAYEELLAAEGVEDKELED